jgi:hypothetical protein
MYCTLQSYMMSHLYLQLQQAKPSGGKQQRPNLLFARRS